ncbi:MAG: hypothetical protein DU429_00030 [Candidatus Tokpelaia sp.]|uniref:hypothetical protein n=1 Tax=Candidatus Tokpelaia sp. TaxID=2233777 RepID=UPI00123B230D|nr:hypothetical protein [Candidatus Tokpelaia sp.]KAA6205554.1 MAG: hypothetical protein DU430_03975 [Candidatus Tokpelaia sp.]KAA6207505.1 MAG: hypothetical protein DU429_00030 [Candidatus Tokpelaia sp.]KAA6404675.1 hypothetical protein DPQ22_06960 [Candidatus Tokpelaia sp.]
MFPYYQTAVGGRLNYAVFIALLAIFLLAACTAGRQPSSLSQNLQQGEKSNIAHFSAPAYEGGISGQAAAPVIDRAAAITRQHNYKYFLLMLDEEQHKATMRPRFGFSYGRQPYGFGDAGGLGGAFGAAPGFAIGSDFSPQRSGGAKPVKWTIYMMRQADKQAVDALSLNKAALGKTAYIYRAQATARSGNSDPIILPLR